MTVLVWALLGVLSFALGWCLVRYLSVPPRQMRAYLAIVLTLLLLLVATLAFGVETKRLLLAGLFGLVCFVAGYAAVTHQVLSMTSDVPLPEITRQKDDPGDGHTAVIYLTHGEPETYSPMGWITMFHELDDTGVPFIPWIARPFFLLQLRRAYLRAGQSQHRQHHLKMLKALEKTFVERGDTQTRFYLAFLDDDPRPDAAAIRALNDRASKIVVAMVFVSISNHTAAGRELVLCVRPQDYAVPVCCAPPLWDSPTLHQAFVDKMNAAIGTTPKDRVGVLLVGHGQPVEWDREFPTETSQELAFREAILRLAEADGYRMDHMSMAWMQFKEPKPAEKIEELVGNGVEKILYFAAAISADSLNSQHDIPELVARARIPDDMPLVNMGGRNDHPLVIRAIYERIQPLLAT